MRSIQKISKIHKPGFFTVQEVILTYDKAYGCIYYRVKCRSAARLNRYRPAVSSNPFFSNADI